MSTFATDQSKLPTPAVLNSEVVFDAFGKMHCDLLRLADGTEYPYYVMHTKAAGVLIIATTADGEYVATQEYRHPVGQALLSFPGGFLEDGEDPIEGAKRELLEETGYCAARWELLGSACPLPGLLSQETHYVRAFDATLTGAPKLEPAEVIQTKLLKAQELRKLIKAGSPVDASLLAALYLSELY